MRDRVFASKDKANLFIKLSRTRQKDSDSWLFDNNKDLFLFALAIGWKHNKRHPLEKRDTEIPLAVFQKSSDNLDFIDAVALSATKDIYILDWNDEKQVDRKLKIIEEFANGGLEYINKKILNNSSGIYDNFLQLVDSEINENGTNNNLDNLEDLIDLI